MAKSIIGGVEIISTLSTKNDGNYPLVMAESVELADGKTVEENASKVDQDITKANQDITKLNQDVAKINQDISKANQDISTKLDKNQGAEHSGKLLGVDETGNTVPALAKGVTYRPDVNCLEFGSAHNLPLLKGILLDETLTKLGHAADSKTVGTKIDALKAADAGLQADVTALQNKEATLTADTDKLKSDVTALQAEDKAIKENATNHNVDVAAHSDIRTLIKDLSDRLATLADSDDQTLDQMSEVVAYIKNNKNLIDGITTSKVNVADIINNLISNVTNKPLSAAQGVELKKLIDALPKNKTDIGLANVTNDKQIKGLAAGTTADHVVAFGADGYTVKDSGFTIGSNVPANAKFTDTVYTHPVSHPATMITEDASHRFMTDTERNKLKGVAENANNYTHPAKHEATIITEDATHRFVTDADKTNWDGKENKNQGVANKGKVMTVGADGNMTPLYPNNVTYDPVSNNLEYGSKDGIPLTDGVKLDTSLSKAGFAAGAKETGDRLGVVENGLTTVKNDFTKLENEKADAIMASASGENVTVTDSSDKPFSNIRLFGKSVQNGVPSAEVPVSIKSVGDSGNITVDVTGRNLLKVENSTSGNRGVTITYKDGEFSLTGEATETGWCILEKIPPIILDGDYCLSSNINIQCGLLDDKYGVIIENKKTENITNRTAAKIYFAVFSGIIYNISGIKLMLNKGSVVLPYEPFSESQTVTITTKNGLCGIKVNKLGNYTDKNGQQWICDEITNTECIQRTGQIASYNNEPITTVYMSSTGQLSVGAQVIYALPNPIITPLTQTEIDEIKKLHTNCPTTIITNDENAHMEVTYTADTKNFILNEIAKYHAQAQAQQVAMMSLLPDSTQAAMIENDTNNILNGQGV